MFETVKQTSDKLTMTTNPGLALFIKVYLAFLYLQRKRNFAIMCCLLLSFQCIPSLPLYRSLHHLAVISMAEVSGSGDAERPSSGRGQRKKNRKTAAGMR